MKKYIGFSIMVLTLMLTSCNDWLDKLPDDRATVDTKEKVAQLLVSAYPEQSVDYMMELSSDNVMDNGSQYTAQPIQEEIYQWKPIETQTNDNPYYVWVNHYMAVATANQALKAISGAPAGSSVEEIIRYALKNLVIPY